MDFERLEVWKRSKALSVATYKQLSNCQDYGFRDQITRSSLSVPSNIAEGLERRSAREKLQFLWIAKGSCGELRTQMLIGKEIGYLPESFISEWLEETVEIARMLMGLIKTIRS